MMIRAPHIKNCFFTLILFLELVSCSKKDQVPASNAANFQDYSLFKGKDKLNLDVMLRRITIQVPDTVYAGIGLIAGFSLSPGASTSIDGRNQESGVTGNNFEQDLHYTITAADHITKKEWTVQASNSDYSISWGLGHFIHQSASMDRSYDWYIDQSTSGTFASVNCGPASVTMAIHWADSGFSKSAIDARATYETDGGWWYTSDIDAYLGKYNITHAIIGLSENADSTVSILTRELDHQQIIILCLDMNYVRPADESDFRVDKFYPTSPGWGHFIVIKGYKKVDGEIFLEANDPYSYGRVNSDYTLKGLNRFYRYKDLAAACLPWWNYAFVIAKNGRPLNLETTNHSLNPLHVPVAHSAVKILN